MNQAMRGALLNTGRFTKEDLKFLMYFVHYSGCWSIFLLDIF